MTTAVVPGLAIKFLRSGKVPANFVALGNKSTDNHNFFSGNISNQADSDSKTTRLGKLQQASGCITTVGLSNKYAQDGTEVASPKFPFEIHFKPAGVQFPTAAIAPEELLTQLESMPSGSHLFDVYTYNSPADKIPKLNISLAR